MADAPTEVFPAVPPDAAPPAAPPEDVAAPPEEDREEDISARVSVLEKQLVDARLLASPQATVRLKVEEPHVGFALGHINVGADYTEVPEHAVAAIMDGAANSGVTITQEEV